MVPRYLPFRERERERELYLLAGGVVCMLQGRRRRRRPAPHGPFASKLIQSQNYAIHELLRCAQSTVQYSIGRSFTPPINVFHSVATEFDVPTDRLGPLHVLGVGAGVVRFLARHEPQDSPANRNAPPFAAPTTFHRHGRPITIIIRFVIAITYIIIKAIEGLRKHSGSKWCCLANLSPTQCGWIPTQQRIQPL
jgi:hypothetical protein